MCADDETDGKLSGFSPGGLLILLGALILITQPGIVFGTRVFTYRDAGLFTYPVTYYFRDCFWHGKWPLWNPYNNCGIPFLAQWNTMTLYPASLIYLLLPMPWSLNVFVLAHLFLAALGMYRLCYYWFGNRMGASIAGLAFAWNGLTLQFLAWSSHVAAFAWMPWVVLACAQATKEGRRRWIWAALAGACQMLTGAPETVVFTWLIVAAVAVFDVVRERLAFWQVAKRLLSIVALVSALSAAQLLPWLDLLAHGDRSAATGGSAWALPPWGLANFLVPLFHSAPSITGVFMQSEQQWTSSYYLGVLPLLLAAVAIWRQRSGRVILLGVITLAAILIAFGDAGLLLPILRRCFPFLGLTRYPIKFVVMAIFSLSLLAGAGAAWLQTQTFAAVRSALSRNDAVGSATVSVALAGVPPDNSMANSPTPNGEESDTERVFGGTPKTAVGTTALPKATESFRLISLAGLLAIGILVILAVAFKFPFPTDSWIDTWRNGIERLVVVAAGTGLLLCAFSAERELTRVLLVFVFLGLMGLDVAFHQPPQNPAVAAEAYASRTPPMSPLPKLGESRAMLSPGADGAMGLLANSDLLQLYFGQRAELYENCNLLDRIPKTDGFFGIHLAWQQKIAALLSGPKSPSRLREFLGVSQLASPRALFTWEAQTNSMPMASIGQKPVFLDDDAMLSALESPQFLPLENVYLPANARSSVQAAADPAARIISSRVQPEECVFETSANSNVMVVIAQSYYHCWKATVDGKPAELLRANYAFQAV
ncbi:MAG TPA: hypothetical protein VHZ30_05575, partial [Verrucomicrobiae bacterium]|nr:hypothetical protein [Verrucomicrobiae bacterium]